MIKCFKHITLPLVCLTACMLHMQAGTLHDLATNNDFNGIESFLKKNGNSEIDTIDATGQTPLFIACCQHNIETAWLLINNGANVNSMITSGIYKGLTPLLFVCAARNNLEKAKELAQLLVKQGATINIQSTCGNYVNTTPLLMACMANNTELAKFLLNHRAKVNAKCTSKNPNGTIKIPGMTALFMACENKNIELAKILLNHGAYPTQGLFAACRLNNSEFARFFITHGALVNTRSTIKVNGTITTNGATALSVTCKNKNCELSTFLIKYGANTHIQILENMPPFKKGETAFSIIKTDWSKKDRSTFATLIPFKNNAEFNDTKIFMRLIFNQLLEQSSLTQPLFKLSNNTPLPQLKVSKIPSLIGITEDFINIYFGEKPLQHSLPKNPFSLQTDPVSNSICTITPFALWLKMNFNITREQYRILYNFLALARTTHTSEKVSTTVQTAYNKLHDITIKVIAKKEPIVKRGTKRKFIALSLK